MTMLPSLRRELVVRCAARSASVDLAGEGGGVHPAVVLELEEQSVARRARKLGGEGHRTAPLAPAIGVAGRMNVQIGQIAFAQRDQMAARAEVGLDGDRLAALQDREAQLCLPAGGGL